MKKIVINAGEDSSWRLSPKATKRLAELRGQKPIFLHIYGNLKSEEASPEEIQESWWWDAFDTFNMASIDDCVENRDDKNLIKVIEELGVLADWANCKLKIVEIPDGVEYKIIDDSGLGPEKISHNV